MVASCYMQQLIHDTQETLNVVLTNFHCVYKIKKKIQSRTNHVHDLAISRQTTRRKLVQYLQQQQKRIVQASQNSR